MSKVEENDSNNDTNNSRGNSTILRVSIIILLICCIIFSLFLIFQPEKRQSMSKGLQRYPRQSQQKRKPTSQQQTASSKLNDYSHVVDDKMNSLPTMKDKILYYLNYVSDILSFFKNNQMLNEFEQHKETIYFLRTCVKTYGDNLENNDIEKYKIQIGKYDLEDLDNHLLNYFNTFFNLFVKGLPENISGVDVDTLTISNHKTYFRFRGSLKIPKHLDQHLVKMIDYQLQQSIKSIYEFLKNSENLNKGKIPQVKLDLKDYTFLTEDFYKRKPYEQYNQLWNSSQQTADRHPKKDSKINQYIFNFIKSKMNTNTTLAQLQKSIFSHHHKQQQSVVRHQKQRRDSSNEKK